MMLELIEKQKLFVMTHKKVELFLTEYSFKRIINKNYNQG